MNRSIRNLLGLLALATTALGLSAVPAFAAPELGVSLERDEGPGGIFATVYHSDERVDFTVKVKNEAAVLGAPSQGEELSCDTDTSEQKWFFDSFIHFSFEFEWVRDGTPVTAWAPATKVLGPIDEPTTYVSTYTVGAADKEHAIQCLVKATNGAGTGSYVAASQPVVVVNPQPAVAPPTPNGPTALSRHPGISGSAQNAGEKLKCTAPTAGWSTSNGVSPISWSFEWIRDGAPAPGTVTPVGATESEYELTAADVSAPAAPAVFQCIAKATNAGPGAAVVESGGIRTIAPAPAFPPTFSSKSGDSAPSPNDGGLSPLVRVEPDANTTSEPVTLELELPGGEETFAYKFEQFRHAWVCDKLPASASQPARAVCTGEELKPPGKEFPALRVITALGADAPDLGTAKATVFGGGAATVSDEALPFPIAPAFPFGLSEFTLALHDEAESDYAQAGGHPFAAVSDVVMNRKRVLVGLNNLPYHPIGQVRQVIVDLPRGVVGNQLALPKLCPGTEAVNAQVCPKKSAVGGILLSTDGEPHESSIYAIEHEFGAPAQFAFSDGVGDVFTFLPRLRPDDGYAVSLELSPAPEVGFLEATTTFCAFGFVKIDEAGAVCKKAGEAGANPKPLFTNPTRCGAPLTWRIRLNSWADPTFFEGPPFTTAALEGCEAVPFEPTADLQPTNHQADSPTGLDVELSMPTEGLEKGDECHQKQGDEGSPLAAECLSESNLRQAKVTFPEGMGVNASAGQGLEACAAAQIKLGSNDPIECPQSSKIGSVEIDTPVIEDTLKGDVYVARQGEVEGSLIGFYLVFDSPKNGILVKMPARVDTDPNTGQLIVTVNESPEQPFSAVRMHFPGGPQATLLTPPKCGSYEISSELTPWSGGAPLTLNSNFSVTEGPGGGPCPTGGLEPVFSAGSSNPLAGQTTPFNLRLSRPDGSDRFSALGLHMPPGLVAYLGGVPRCPEAAIAQARGREALGQGQAEIEDPSCPAASRIGSVVAGAGAGENPLYVDTGKAYLAGPYKGAPLSIVVIAPAVAGPLDLGAAVVRNAVDIDPQTAEVSVLSDPIPTILHGILLDIRDVRVAIDRPNFTLNPTDCEPLSVGARIAGLSGAVASLANRFQVGGCENLGFKPKLSLRLKGGTKRGAHPALRAEVHPREGDANFAGAVVTLPRSAFLDQAHIRTICTRVQFAAHQCPAGSIYGQARAVTPLLDEPLEGPVYLRSSEHKLPDLVVALKGPPSLPLEFNLASRVDSVHGGIRSSFEAIPDVPVTEFVLEMQGGNKGLIVNSTDLCPKPHRVAADLSAQNGMAYEAEPALQAKCKKHHKGKARHRRHRHHGAAR